MKNRLSSIIRAFALAAIIISFHTTARAQVAPMASGTGWGGGGTMNTVPKHSTLSIQSDSAQSCTDMYISGYIFINNRMWRQAFDTLTHLIETCPNNSNSPRAFSMITSAVAGLYGADGGTYRATYLAWLKSVLYLNTTNPEYFCACVEAMANTLPLTNDTAPGHVSRWTNIGLSLTAWLLRNTTCDTPQLAEQYDWSRENQLRQWANNPGSYKLDTTLPPISTWGLDTLLAKHFQYAWVPNGGDFGKHVASYSVSENPLHEATTLRFELSDAEYVRVEVFDVLGSAARMAAPRDLSGLYPAGEHTMPISLTGLPSGTYYLRITLGTGEVRTIKLVKE